MDIYEFVFFLNGLPSDFTDEDQKEFEEDLNKRFYLFYKTTNFIPRQGDELELNSYSFKVEKVSFDFSIGDPKARVYITCVYLNE